MIGILNANKSYRPGGVFLPTSSENQIEQMSLSTQMVFDGGGKLAIS